MPVLRQPSSAARISGKLYDMEPNALGFEVVSFDFSDPEAARLRFELLAAMGPSADGSFDLGVGLDGRYKISPAGPRGYNVGLKGVWRDSNRFDLDYVEPAGANAFTMHFDFADDDWISVKVKDKAGLFGRHDLMGTYRQP